MENTKHVLDFRDASANLAANNQVYMDELNKVDELNKLNELDKPNEDKSDKSQKLEMDKSWTISFIIYLVLLIIVVLQNNSFGSFGNSEYKRSSRYCEEFQEINYIGGGNFGKVYKALHYFDNTEYAIKKIAIRSKESILQYLNEIRILAKLNDPHIISYKTVWIEPLDEMKLVLNMLSTNHEFPYMSGYTEESDNSQDNENLHSNENSSNFSGSDKQDLLYKRESSYTNGQQIMEENIFQESVEENNSDIVSFRNSKNSENTNSIKDDACTDDSDLTEETSVSSTNQQKEMTLYIQMSLCEQTLKQWMEIRTNITLQSMVIIFEHILHGIDYIHSKGIVHHDIKPDNIFISISKELQIYLGDFGLSCLQEGTKHPGKGTQGYAAPEQLKGECNQKSDIYSVGIILTELLFQTQSQMELSHIIKDLKNDKIPETLPSEQHDWAKLIIKLIQEDPAERPKAKQLLCGLNNDKDKIIIDLKNDLHDKDNMIKKLQEENMLLKQEGQEAEQNVERFQTSLEDIVVKMLKYNVKMDKNP